MSDSYSGCHSNLDENGSLGMSLNWKSIPGVVSQISAGPSGWVGCRQEGRNREGAPRCRNGLAKDLTTVKYIVY